MTLAEFEYGHVHRGVNAMVARRSIGLFLRIEILHEAWTAGLPH